MPKLDLSMIHVQRDVVSSHDGDSDDEEEEASYYEEEEDEDMDSDTRKAMFEQ